MERINATSLKLVKEKTKNGFILLYTKLDSFKFPVSTRNKKVEDKFINDNTIDELPIYLDLTERQTKEGKLYLSIDVYVENEDYIFSLYCDDRNISFLFNQYMKNYVRSLLTEDEIKKYGI